MWQANGRLLISNQHNDINTTLSHIGEWGGVRFIDGVDPFIRIRHGGQRPRGCDIYLFVGGERKTYSMYLVVLGLHRLPPLQTTALLGGGGVVHYSKKRKRRN